MFDILEEEMLSLAELIELLPRGRRGRPLQLSTVMKWITDGTPSLSGEVVKLEAIRIGKRWISSREALKRFVARLTTPEGQPESRDLAAVN